VVLAGPAGPELQEVATQLGEGRTLVHVVDVIAFLAGHDARFVSGVNLPVDGGLTASNGQPRQA
jgi:meso-butanediol dehydrogenase / (S,S)-butanediol dehydrogenase / diacetyl reductase